MDQSDNPTIHSDKTIVFMRRLQGIPVHLKRGDQVANVAIAKFIRLVDAETASSLYRRISAVEVNPGTWELSFDGSWPVGTATAILAIACDGSIGRSDVFSLPELIAPESITIKFPGGSGIRGFVHGCAESLKEEVQVIVTQLDNWWWLVEPLERITRLDSDGSFTFQSLPSGRYAARAISREWRSDPVEVDVLDRGITPAVELVMRRSSNITGVVRAPNGTIVPGAIVLGYQRKQLTTQAVAQRLTCRTVANKSGHYTLYLPLDGWIGLRVVPPVSSATSSYGLFDCVVADKDLNAELHASNGSSHVVDLELLRCCSVCVHGIVTSNGQPLQNVLVSAHSVTVSDQELIGSDKTDATGAFGFAVVSSRELNLTFWDSSLRRIGSKQLTVSDAGTYNVDLEVSKDEDAGK
jgi:hypothetical protein